MKTEMRTAVIGGGAAGFFLAIRLKELCPRMEVTIMERGQRVLTKVEVSGGGRCNCTNTFEDVADLQTVYPRGARLLGRLFRHFGPRDAFDWFEQRGVPLVVQADHCVFPRSQDAHSIVHLFLSEARRLGIGVRTGCPVNRLDQVADYHFVAVATGGHAQADAFGWLGQPVVQPVPSLFTFSIADADLRALMGTVVEQATVMLPGTRLRASGPLLITHWGMSGPCILRLSSYAARLLHEQSYRMPLAVNWLGMGADEAQTVMASASAANGRKLLTTVCPFPLGQRLWGYLLEKSLAGRAHSPWGSLNRKEMNRLLNVLTNDTYQISGRAPFRDEFVTAGGVSLQAVNPATLESKTRPGLYFAGEVLDIDGITGGFNFQAAWTTAHTVAQAIANDIKSLKTS